MDKLIFRREKGSKISRDRIYEASNDEKLHPDYVAAKICMPFFACERPFYPYETFRAYLEVEVLKEYRRMDCQTLKPVLRAYAGIEDKKNVYFSQKAIELIFFCRRDERGALLASHEVHYAIRRLCVKDQECYINFLQKAEEARKKADSEEAKLMALPQTGQEVVVTNLAIAKQKLEKFQESQLLEDFLEARNAFIFAAAMDFRFKVVPGENLLVYKTVARIFEIVDF